MLYLHFLRRVHKQLQPSTYLEIGIHKGWSMSLARCRSVGVDPEFQVDAEITAPASLLRRTSDDFFAGLPAEGPFEGKPVDLAFVDGMHQFEFALRDFINIERLCTWSSVVVFDDVLPTDPVAASRERQSQVWSGDIFKIEQVLRQDRPDLSFLTVNTEVAGLLLIFGLDPTNRVLADASEALIKANVTPDPQEVPDDVLQRKWALDAEQVLQSPVWELLRERRDALDPQRGREAIRKSLSGLDQGPAAPRKSRWKH